MNWMNTKAMSRLGKSLHRRGVAGPNCWLTVFMAACCWSSLSVAQPGNPPVGAVKATYTTTIPNGRHPELVYWFWTNDTLEDDHYLQDVQNIAKRSRFDFLMMTDRTVGQGFVFHDTQRMHDPFAKTVKEAHASGLKVGLQLWAEGYPKLTKTEACACVTEGEVELDASGRAEYTAVSRWVLEGGHDATNGKHEPIASEPLKAFAFRKNGDGTYAPDSLVELPASAITVTRSSPATVKLQINGSAKLAGDTVYVLVAHFVQFPDLFNGVMNAHLEKTLSHYRDIPFDGTALDEFGWMMLQGDQPDKSAFRDRIYGQAFAAEFNRQKGRPLETALFQMRYSTAGERAQRIRAINDYFDVLRQGPLRVERAFYKYSRQLFGPGIFAGVHNTFHNALETDEIWRTGINWWRIPRAYGQSDENISLPVRMGLLVSATEPVEYDQFYSPDVSRYTKKVMAEVPYNGRTHYHAWNDKGAWGTDIGSTNALAVINPLEEKVRLLNQFDPAPPKLPILIVFGMPAQLNWFPDAAARNAWDINTLDIEQKAVSVWNAGYPCALVSSDLIDDGNISVDVSGRPVIKGHVFDAVIYLYPQYSTPATLTFLERLVKARGRLMLEGQATADFAGRDISNRFAGLAAKATVRGFDLEKIPALGVVSREPADGAVMEDGSVIMSDLDSLASGKPKSFEIWLNGHTWSGTYVGVFALKADLRGNIEKLAAGGFAHLFCDGKSIFSLSTPADLFIRREPDGRYHALIKGCQETNSLTFN